MNRFEVVRDDCRKHMDVEIILPKKATVNSVGYDFYSPGTTSIGPRRRYTFWTDVKVCLNRDEALIFVPRSSVGIEKSLMVANTVGTIDPDYYGNEKNDGNIAICLYNYGKHVQRIRQGDRIVQGIIIKIACDEEEMITTMQQNPKKRIGGLGSTGK